MIKEKLDGDKLKINWNKNPIKMDVFVSFIKVPLTRSYDHLGAGNGWTQLENKEHKLIIKGGIIGDTEYLDGIQYGIKLANQYNNYVNPFYLLDIMTNEGKLFFINYYKDDIDEILKRQEIIVSQLNKKLTDNIETQKKLINEYETDYKLTNALLNHETNNSNL